MGRHSHSVAIACSDVNIPDTSEDGLAQAGLSDTAENQSRLRQVLVPVLIVLVGVGILLYPIVSTLWNNAVQRQVADEYAGLIAETDTATVEAQLAAAHEYNRTRTVGPVLDPWTVRLSDDNEPYKAYLQQLNLSGVMARIVIPSIDVDLPVYHGTRADTLERGVGHLFGTDLPVGGDNTHSVLTGHSGLQTATLFDNLTDVKIGDSVYLDVYGQKLRYVVYDTQVVLPDHATGLEKQDGRDLLTLITCTPYGVNSHRLLVHAERAPMDAQGETAMDSVGFQMQWWMWLFAAGALLTILLLIGFLFKTGKQNTGNTRNTGNVGESVLPDVVCSNPQTISQSHDGL